MRSRNWTTASIAVATLLFLLSPPAGAAHFFWRGQPDLPPKALPDNSQQMATAVLEAVNRFREAHQLPPVRLDERLNQAAQSHANFMARSGQVEHTGENGWNPGQRLQQAGYTWRVIGENIAAGQTSAEEVVNDWIGSPHHRANLLKAGITHIGVGHRNDYWALDLAG